jgi:hypothetical protein
VNEKRAKNLGQGAKKLTANVLFSLADSTAVDKRVFERERKREREICLSPLLFLLFSRPLHPLHQENRSATDLFYVPSSFFQFLSFYT